MPKATSRSISSPPPPKSDRFSARSHSKPERSKTIPTNPTNKSTGTQNRYCTYPETLPKRLGIGANLSGRSACPQKYTFLNFFRSCIPSPDRSDSELYLFHTAARQVQ